MKKLRNNGAEICNEKFLIFFFIEIFVATYVLEHTLHPVNFLKKISSNLVQGGIVFVEVPYKDCLYKNVF